jgi:hypothetical protein
MGTSNGNIGRPMYSNPIWRAKVSAAITYNRIKITKYCPKCNTPFIVERTVNKDGIQHIKIERWYNTDGTLTVDRAQSEFESPPSDRLVSYKDIVKW